MKANGAPEKLYLIQHNGLISFCRNNNDDIEFTRADAFIEKAVEYMITHIPDMHILGVSNKIDECIIKEFRKYMEGE